MRSRRFVGSLFTLITFLVFMFLLAPVAIVVIMAFNESELGTLPITGYTFRWFMQLARNEEIVDALKISLRLGVIAATGAVLIGTAAALALARYRVVGKSTIQLLLTLPILIPNVVLGVSLLLAFRIFGQVQSFTLLAIGHIVLALPFVVLMTQHRLQAISPFLEEAARTLGANHWQTFREITLPLALPAIVGGGLFAFMTSFDEVAATLFWRPANLETVTTQVMAMLEHEITPEVNALATFLIVVSIGMPVLGIIIARWWMSEK